MAPQQSFSPEDLLVFLGKCRDAKSFSLVSVVIVVYDYVLTFEQEVQYIHASPRTLSRALFLANRYFTISLIPTHSLWFFHPNPPDYFCIHGLRFSVIGGVLSNFLVHSILILRVHALFNQSRRILYPLLLVLVTCTSASLIVACLSIRSSHLTRPPPGVSPLPGITGCKMSPPKPFYWAVYVGPVVFEVIVFVLTFSKTFKTVRGPLKAPVLQHFYDSGLVHFSVMFIALIFTMIACTTKELALVVMSAHFVVTLMSVSCSRMLLMVRAIVLQPQDMSLFSEFAVTTGQSLELSNTLPCRTAPSASTSDATATPSGYYSGSRLGKDDTIP